MSDFGKAWGNAKQGEALSIHSRTPAGSRDIEYFVICEYGMYEVTAELMKVIYCAHKEHRKDHPDPEKDYKRFQNFRRANDVREETARLYAIGKACHGVSMMYVKDRNFERAETRPQQRKREGLEKMKKEGLW
jgi:hypothetical protein